MMLKSLLYSLFFFCFLSGEVYPQWVQQTSGTNTRLTGIYFFNENTGWICGNGIVLKTSNAGVNWTQQNLSGHFTSIDFTDSNTGWICGLYGVIYKTTDGGFSWFVLNSGTTQDLTSIRFLNSNTGIASGYFNTIIRTTNGGSTWINTLDSGYTHFLASFGRAAGNFVYVSGSSGIVNKSTDGGATWDSLNVGMPNSVNTLTFINVNSGWTFGCCGAYYRTTNGGASWIDGGYLTFGYILLASYFIDGNTGWTAGEQGNILRTTDGGLSWDSLVGIGTTGYNSIAFVNSSTGWIAGENGVILKTTNSGGQGFPIGIKAVSNGMPNQFFLYQNYPNPFNPVTKIKFDIPFSPLSFGEGIGVRLLVFDILGREVATLVDGVMKPGSYEVEFNSHDFPDKTSSSGVYFYRLTLPEDKSGSGNIFSQTKRMILLK